MIHSATVSGLVLRVGCCKCGSALQYADLLGHDHEGHRATNALGAAGFAYTTDVALTSDADLLRIRNLGPRGVARIRERIPRSGIDPETYSPASLQSRLPRGLYLEPWMYSEPVPAAALWMLSLFHSEDDRIWPHVHPDSIDVTAMDGELFQPTEQLLLDTARSFYTGEGSTNLALAADLLNEVQWRSLLEALRIRRDGARGAS